MLLWPWFFGVPQLGPPGCLFKRLQKPASTTSAAKRAHVAVELAHIVLTFTKLGLKITFISHARRTYSVTLMMIDFRRTAAVAQWKVRCSIPSRDRPK